MCPQLKVGPRSLNTNRTCVSLARDSTVSLTRVKTGFKFCQKEYCPSILDRVKASLPDAETSAASESLQASLL